MESLVSKLGQRSFYSKPSEDVDETLFVEIKAFLPSNLDKCLSPLLVFLLEHLPLEVNGRLFTSTSKSNSFGAHVEEILALLCRQFNVSNLGELLRLEIDAQPLYQRCWTLLKPFLEQNTYEENPLALKIFVHLVKAMRRETLSDFLEPIFRVSLLALDDASVEFKFVGLDLIDHLQRNCTSAELSLYNRSAVIM